MSSLHVIFGAGQVGASLARLLHRRGERVRVVRRSDKPVGEGIPVVSADARDPAQAIEAAAGASVVYHCMNPSAYTGAAWADELPRLGDAVIAAAQSAGARLVCLDNLYGYGPTDSPRTPQSPMAAEGAKGRVRAAWDARLREAGEGGLRWTAGRAGDFFGPGAGGQSVFSQDMVRGLGGGRPALLLGDPQQPHAFSFVPDVVAGLAALGRAADDVEGQAWHLPVHTVAPRVLVGRLAAAQGRRGWAVTLSAGWLRVLGWGLSLFRELQETLYQWDRPFLVDDQPFRARFPGVGVSLDEAVSASVADATGPTPIAAQAAAV